MDLEKLREITEKLQRSMLLKGIAYQVLDTFIKQQEEALSIGDVTNSFAIVRWSENENEDIVCANRYVANEYIRKYNKLTGKETLYLDEDTWLPVTEP